MRWSRRAASRAAIASLARREKVVKRSRGPSWPPCVLACAYARLAHLRGRSVLTLTDRGPTRLSARRAPICRTALLPGPNSGIMIFSRIARYGSRRHADAALERAVGDRDEVEDERDRRRDQDGDDRVHREAVHAQQEARRDRDHAEQQHDDPQLERQRGVRRPPAAAGAVPRAACCTRRWFARAGSSVLRSSGSKPKRFAGSRSTRLERKARRFARCDAAATPGR